MLYVVGGRHAQSHGAQSYVHSVIIYGYLWSQEDVLHGESHGPPWAACSISGIAKCLKLGIRRGAVLAPESRLAACSGPRGRSAVAPPSPTPTPTCTPPALTPNFSPPSTQPPLPSPRKSLVASLISLAPPAPLSSDLFAYPPLPRPLPTPAPSPHHQFAHPPHSLAFGLHPLRLPPPLPFPLSSSWPCVLGCPPGPADNVPQ